MTPLPLNRHPPPCRPYLHRVIIDNYGRMTGPFLRYARFASTYHFAIILPTVRCCTLPFGVSPCPRCRISPTESYEMIVSFECFTHCQASRGHIVNVVSIPVSPEGCDSGTRTCLCFLGKINGCPGRLCNFLYRRHPRTIAVLNFLSFLHTRVTDLSIIARGPRSNFHQGHLNKIRLQDRTLAPVLLNVQYHPPANGRISLGTICASRPVPYTFRCISPRKGLIFQGTHKSFKVKNIWRRYQKIKASRGEFATRWLPAKD